MPDDLELRKEQIKQELDEFAQTHPDLGNLGGKVSLLEYMKDKEILDFETAYQSKNGKLDADEAWSAMGRVFDRGDKQSAANPEPQRETVNKDNFGDKFDQFLDGKADKTGADK